MQYVLHARDVIAGILAIGALSLMAAGIDGTVGAILLAIVAFYFGADTLEKRRG